MRCKVWQQGIVRFRKLASPYQEPALFTFMTQFSTHGCFVQHELSDTTWVELIIIQNNKLSISKSNNIWECFSHPWNPDQAKQSFNSMVHSLWKHPVHSYLWNTDSSIQMLNFREQSCMWPKTVLYGGWAWICDATARLLRNTGQCIVFWILYEAIDRLQDCSQWMHFSISFANHKGPHLL